MTDITKILYKEFIKEYKHPVMNKDYTNIKIYSSDLFAAYLEILGEKYKQLNKDIFDTQKYRYYLLTDNDKQKFDNIFNIIKKLKKKCIILLMLSAEQLALSPIESLKTNKFSTMFTNMTIDKLAYNGVDTKWLQRHNFFK